MDDRCLITFRHKFSGAKNAADGIAWKCESEQKFFSIKVSKQHQVLVVGAYPRETATLG